MTGPVVHVDGLAMRYGERTVLDGVSLTVDAGEVVALVGPNGAGKTTTVETIEGYRRGQAGRVTVLGSDPWAADRAHRARVGLMLQDGGLDMRARPAESLRQYARFHADPLDPARLLDELGLRAVASTPYRACPAASGSDWGSPSPWSAGPRSSCSMSPRPAWMPRRARSSVAASTPSGSGGSPCS